MAQKRKIKINKLLTKVIILITFVIIFKAYLSQKQFLENATVQVLGSVNQKVPLGALASLELWFSDLFHFNQIRRENLQLKAENINLVQEINYLSSLKEENELLKGALKIKEEKKSAQVCECGLPCQPLISSMDTRVKSNCPRPRSEASLRYSTCSGFTPNSVMP